jgi:uncharacterized membrane protein YraQ (UPF0718 family)
VAVGLRRNGASPGAAATLWIGNPTLNPAVLVFIVLTLGWGWAVLRLVLGLALVVAAAAVTMRLTATTRTGARQVDAGMLDASGAPVTEPARTGSPLAAWLGSVVRMAIQLTPEYLIMIALLGAARAFLFPSGVFHLGSSPAIIVALALGGTLFAIPTAGEVPIIQTMLASGVGAGPAGALLLTLAPLSLPSMVMLGRVLPARVLVAIAGLTIAAGILAGFLAVGLHL